MLCVLISSRTIAVRDTYCSYSVMDTCLRELANSATTMKVIGIYEITLSFLNNGCIF